MERNIASSLRHPLRLTHAPVKLRTQYPTIRSPPNLFRHDSSFYPVVVFCTYNFHDAISQHIPIPRAQAVIPQFKFIPHMLLSMDPTHCRAAHISSRPRLISSWECIQPLTTKHTLSSTCTTIRYAHCAREIEVVSLLRGRYLIYLSMPFQPSSRFSEALLGNGCLSRTSDFFETIYDMTPPVGKSSKSKQGQISGNNGVLNSYLLGECGCHHSESTAVVHSTSTRLGY
jgi:hypothetical protein